VAREDCATSACSLSSPRERLGEVQATADVGLVTLAPAGPHQRPSKMLGYMARGVPSWLAWTRTQTQLKKSDNMLGVVVKPGDPSALATPCSARGPAELRDEYGSAGRQRLESFTPGTHVSATQVSYAPCTRGLRLGFWGPEARGRGTGV